MSTDSPYNVLRISALGGYRIGKRIIDVLASAICLLVSCPLLGIAMLLIKLTSPGPIMFRQERLGLQGHTFTIWKLRTMTDSDHMPAMQVLGDHPGVTRVGRTLRRYKIDELPQLINVMVGDMSLVGPRPGLPEHLEHYTPLAHRRLAVRPGLTGLAQVSGNIHLSWPERWVLDAQYVETVSLWLDIRIVVKTIFVIVLGEGRFLRWRAGG